MNKKLSILYVVLLHAAIAFILAKSDFSDRVSRRLWPPEPPDITIETHEKTFGKRKVMPQPTSGTVIARFEAGIGETVSSLKLSAWADQSGNGYDVTQATASLQPLVEANGLSRVAHDVAKGRQVLDRWGSAGQFPLNASTPFDFQNLSMFVVARTGNSALKQVNSELVLGTPFGFTVNRDMLWTASGKLQFFDQSGNDPIAQVPCGQLTCAPTVYACRLHAGGSQFAFGDRIIPGNVAATAHTSTGGWIGRGYASGFVMPSSPAYEFVFVRDLDSAGFTEWCQWLQAKWNGGTYTPKTSTCVFVGDSTCAGEPWYTTNSTLVEKLSDLFPACHMLSAAVNSQTVSTTGGNQVDQQILRSQFLLDGTLATGEVAHPFANRLCVIMGGTNDINGSVSYATLKAGFTARVSEAKAFGATRVGICTIMDSAFYDSTKRTVRNSINADIKNLASGIGHDFYINLHEAAEGGDVRFDDAVANVGGVFIDQVHPSTIGRDSLVTIIGNKLAAELGAASITAATPTIGSAYLVGSTYSVAWDSVGASGTVNIKLSTDGGSTFPITLASAIADTESYSWTPEASHCSATTQIKIEDAADTDVFGVTGNLVVATTTPGSVSGGNETAEWSTVRALLASNGIKVIRP
jgi:hypothetical protein